MRGNGRVIKRGHETKYARLKSVAPAPFSSLYEGGSMIGAFI